MFNSIILCVVVSVKLNIDTFPMFTSLSNYNQSGEGSFILSYTKLMNFVSRPSMLAYSYSYTDIDIC